MVTQTVVRMSEQTVAGTKPKAKKAKQEHEEDRDTTDPRVVVDFFTNTLRPLCNENANPQIEKHTREEVLWKDCRSPWRRSALWLLIRVTLQLVIFRSSGGQEPHRLYKEFMVFLMSSIVERASEQGSGEMVHLMMVRTACRVLKLNLAVAPAWFKPVQKILDDASRKLNLEWQRIMDHCERPIGLDGLQYLNFGKDIQCALPQLDKYLVDLSSRGDEKSQKEFHPSAQLIEFNPREIPTGVASCPTEHLVPNLCALENWAESHLDAWIEANLEHRNTWMQVGDLIAEYHDAASKSYSQNPEAISMMLLTLYELWIAFDKATLHSLPLLRDYNACVPADCLSSLLLPFKSQMIRVANVENYLKERQRQSKYQGSGIFRDFGTRTSFSVRYFDQSTEHQHLLQIIEQRATREREQKRSELRNKHERYTRLMTEASQIECQMEEILVNKRFGIYETRHSRSCPCHKLKSRAKELSISTHEWPLPHEPLRAKSVVFELQVPDCFVAWRDTTLYVLRNCLGFKYVAPEQPRSECLLTAYQELLPFLTPGRVQRISVLSQTKPHAKTHRHKKSVINVTEADVCLNHGPHFQYFDKDTGYFVDNLEQTEGSETMCGYRLPQESHALQQFLCRTSRQPHGPSPNTVIATQHATPATMSLNEYRSLASIPLGLEIQWQNILLELTMPSIDLKKVETTFFIRQVTNQAGLPNEDPWMRTGHAVLKDPKFTAKALTSIQNATERIKENWNKIHGLDALIQVTLKISSLSPSSDERGRFLAHLQFMRHISFGWIQRVKQKASQEVDDAIKTELVAKSVHIALVCVATFDADDLAGSFALSSEVSIFLQCCMAIWNGRQSLSLIPGSLLSILFHRWQVLCYRSHLFLLRKCSVGPESPLNSAIQDVWAAYPGDANWAGLSQRMSYWLHAVCPSQSTSSMGVHVHYNLLTGELLVDGLALARLPCNYESNKTYRMLFGKSQLDVMPSNMPGMQFSCQQEYSGYTVHLGKTTHCESSQGDIWINASKDGQTWEFVPQSVFSGHFPDEFVDNYAHWYAIGRGIVEFRPLGSPWASPDQLWRLCKSKHQYKWCLENPQFCLTWSLSPTAKALTQVFEPLERSSKIHCLLGKSDGKSDPVLHIDIPRLRLAFSFSEKSTSVHCRQYPDTLIDVRQGCGSLVGLRNRLYLVNPYTGDRLMLVPEGDLSWSAGEGHVQTSVVWQPTSQVHAFSIDEQLGRLVDNGSMQSKLFLAYIHAVTSYFLPDPLTKRTGTEQALTILRSASVRSFDRLRRDDSVILTKIAALTPQREFYPKNEQVMQSIQWRSLNSLSQHPSFYEEVAAIREQNLQTCFYYPETDLHTPSLLNMNCDLLQRDRARSSSFRIFGFGAEDYTNKHDREYKGRDSCRSSAKSARVFTISQMLCGRVFRTHELGETEWLHRIWRFLSVASEMPSSVADLNPLELRYSAEWAHKSHGFIAKNWCAIHHSVASQDRRVNIYQLMIWLSTVAYLTDMDMIVLETIASLFLAPELLCDYHVMGGMFDLTKGFEWDSTAVNNFILSGKLSSTPEDDIGLLPHESYQDFQSRIMHLRSSRQNEACRVTLSHLSRQWPTRSPSRPASPRTLNLERYLDIHGIMAHVNRRFRHWSDNRMFRDRLEGIIRRLAQKPSQYVHPRSYPPMPPPARIGTRAGFICFDDLLSKSPSLDVTKPALRSLVQTRPQNIKLDCDISDLVTSLRSHATSQYERNYVRRLESSVISLEQTRKQRSFSLPHEEIQEYVKAYHEECEKYAKDTFSAIVSWLRPPILTGEQPAFQTSRVSTMGTLFTIDHAPRLSPMLFIEQLNRHRWPCLSNAWRRAFLEYGVSLTMLQKAKRLRALAGSPEDLLKELGNPGHGNWDPFERTENLLLEIENGILIRNNQADIAETMVSTSSAHNIVLQLNMGDGKSSVVVPMVAAALADGRCLSRVFTPKPQSRQMHEMLVGKLGGLLSRRLYHLPFSRSLKLGETEADHIYRICLECMSTGGVMLVQPEHILSLKLMSLECFISGRPAVGRSLLQTLRIFDERGRDVIDESDENFSVKFELIYSMGAQQPVEFAPQRWNLIQKVLQLVCIFASKVDLSQPGSIEVLKQENGGFPRTRVLDQRADRALVQKIAEHVCEHGIEYLPISRQPQSVRKAVLAYIVDPQPTVESISAVENDEDGLWSETFRDGLLLLRGLFAGGVLAFCLGQKRWRVNFGPDPHRQPPTRLAVPYRAKDSPSLRSEFSHPDVVILLTCLHYYYNGLTDDDLALAFEDLVKCDEADAEYQAWARDAPLLAPAYQRLPGVNLDDQQLCVHSIFPALRFSKAAVDYFLAHVVFPREMKEFPEKLSASGWDIGALKMHPAVGFSGTNDSRQTLPLTVEQLDLPEQNHTNALVLEHLLRAENSAVDIPPRGGASNTDAQVLLKLVTHLDRSTKVILDVGAQVLELSNLEVAKTWLAMVLDDHARAVVFVDDQHNICVVDRSGRVEALQTSPFAQKMDACLVFLDEAHTRGIDLKLPVHYRAAVTLGMGITKDKLVQGSSTPLLRPGNSDDGSVRREKMKRKTKST